MSELKEVRQMETDTVTFGFIFSEKKQQHLYQNMIHVFRKLSSKHNKRIVLFTLNHLDLDEQVVYGTIVEGDNITQGISEIPPYIYNLSLHTTTTQIKKMSILRKMENTVIINPINRFIQAIIFEMLTSKPDFQPYILPTVSFSTSTLIDYLKQYETIFLLPEKTFHPPKAVIIKRLPNHDYMIDIGQNSQRCEKGEIVNYIKKMIHKKKYIIMKGMELLKKEGYPLEAKIYLQKNNKGEWSITTNSSRHGIFTRNEYSYSRLMSPVHKLYGNEMTEYEKLLADLSLEISKFLDYYIPFVGSFTFDFIFEENNHPYLIYVSGFEQNQNLYQHMDPDVQKQFLNHAFYFLLFLQNNDLMEKGAIE